MEKPKEISINCLLDSEEEVFFLYNLKDGTFQQISPAFENLWERKHDTIIQDTTLLLSTIHPDDFEILTSLYNEVKNGATSVTKDFRILTPNNNIKWVRSKCWVLSTESGSHSNLFGFVEDITAAVEHKENLLTINEKKNMTLHIVGHDLRGPIALINMATSLIEKELSGKNTEQITTYINVIQETCKNSINFISDLLELEYLESAKVELKKSRIDIISKIKLVFQTYGLAGKTEKQFEIISSKESVYLVVDEVRMMQALENLISNAFKFTRADGKITVKVEELSGVVRLTIEDNGIGIPKKFHPFIFDKFTKARRQGIHGEKSIGLGLHIIKHVIELHQGNIWFESEEHKGTRFYIDLPRI